ncbi:MAG: transcriptional regulator, AraC family [Firmicutes bacterium]|nr:transcriptional regulator, AraC family [Bacillota bacterium]
MKEGEKQVWYKALKAKDVRFDGRFFVGVSSTGIYCRPVCRAKLPKAENCIFFSTAAAAEQAGFRPCLLCRPELAPGTSAVDATASLVHRAARILEECCGSGQSLEELAARLGCTSRHLRRAFTAEYNVSPVQYLQTCRLLLAKNLLTDTNLSVLDVAMAAGFGSLRRFNDLFKKQYRLAPTALRRQTAEEKGQESTVTLALGYRPPYQWQQLLDFLAQRVIPGVEAVRNGEYWRTVRFVTGERRYVYGWVRVGHRPQKNTLTVTMSSSLLPVLPRVLARVRHLFDLYCDPDAVGKTLLSMNNIHPGLCVPGTRLPGCFDPFEMAVRAVLGQQITVKAASTLAARLVETYGTPVQTGIEGLTHAFPRPEDIVVLDGPISNHLGPLGIIATRANTILELARAFVQNAIDFGFCARPDVEMKKLMAIPGIGTWTAQYIAMRAMGWPDAFLQTDHGVKKALAPHTPKEILALAEEWRPWRSYATISLWNSL